MSNKNVQRETLTVLAKCNIFEQKILLKITNIYVIKDYIEVINKYIILKFITEPGKHGTGFFFCWSFDIIRKTVIRNYWINQYR